MILFRHYTPQLYHRIFFIERCYNCRLWAEDSWRSGDEAEFIAFKAGKMVDDNTTFEQAVDALTAERRKTTFDWTAPVGEGTPQAISLNERINKELRGH